MWRRRTVTRTRTAARLRPGGTIGWWNSIEARRLRFTFGPARFLTGLERMNTVLLATRNTHKVQEIRAILGDGLRYLMLNDVPGVPEVVEDAPTFGGNATKKAAQLARWLADVQGSKFNVQGSTVFVL